jgi:hypothetical protein
MALRDNEILAMSVLKQLDGFSGIDRKGNPIMVAESYIFGESIGFGVYVQIQNYKAGKIIKSWRYVVNKKSKEEALRKFNSLIAA